MEKVLILLRGLPGSGKSTFANMMWGEYNICEADQYFYIDGEYKFDASKLKEAHQWCQDKVRKLMNQSDFYSEIVVANTSTTEKEMQPYLDLAKEFEYHVVSLVVENRHGNSSVHGVPQETLKKMQDRFEIKLV
jgi:predicted kinase